MSNPTPANQPALKVLHVIPSMAVEAGGPPVVCAGLAWALAARGHQVAIATVEQPGQTQVAISPPVTLHSFPPDAPQDRYVKSTALDRWLRDEVRSFDILHLHSLWQFPTFAAARAAWAARKPYVVLLNGMLDRYSVSQRSYWIKRAYWLWREGKIHARSAGIHCLNRAEIRRAVPWIAHFPKFIIGNGIDQAQLAALPPRGQFRAAHPEFAHDPLVIFLSRVHPKKGLDRLIPAWKIIGQSMSGARLLIAGTGDPDYMQALRELVAAHGLESQILFLGQLVGPEKWHALVDSDLFVLPSHQEGFSMAITEALAAGCPPVVTQECNFDELAPPPPESPRGVIIKNGDMTAFTQAVHALLQDPGQRRALAAAGQSLVGSQYTWQKIAADLEQIYHDILAHKPLLGL